MTSMLVWSRRSLAIWMAPFLLAALVYGAWSRDGWQYEWLWGMRAVLLTAPIVSPLVAGAVAFDVVRRWNPVLEALGPSTRRWRLATLSLVAAHVLWAMLCVGVAWIIAGTRLILNPSMWQPDPLLPLEVLASVTAAAMVGLLVGRRVTNLAAPPLAAVIVFGIESLTIPYGLMSLFSPTALVDSAVGLERNPASAGLAIALNVSVAVICATIALRGNRRTRRWWAVCLAAVVAFVAVAVVERTSPPLEFQPTSGPRLCLQEAEVEVCGPRNVRSLLATLGNSIDAALTSLSASQLPLPRRFVLGVPGTVPPVSDNRAVASVSPAQLREGARTSTLARILAQPRFCSQYVDPSPETTALLDRQQLVSTWLQRALEGGDQPAPMDVRRAYDDLLSCTPTS